MEMKNIGSFESPIRVENEILRNNIRELQEQLQNAYTRIKELTEPEQMELDV